MSNRSSMRRVWLGICLALALLTIYPAILGRVSWWWPGLCAGLFALIAAEPWLLAWQLRRRGEELQITDRGVLRRLARGDAESVSWSDLREVSIVMTQGVNLSDEFFYVLAGRGTAGVIIGQRLATRHDLLSHLQKLPGFDHRSISSAMASGVNQRFVLWRAPPLEGEATVLADPALH